MADDPVSKELASLAHREAMLRRAAKRLLDDAERLRERHKRIVAQARKLRAAGEPFTDFQIEPHNQ